MIPHPGHPTHPRWHAGTLGHVRSPIRPGDGVILLACIALVVVFLLTRS